MFNVTSITGRTEALRQAIGQAIPFLLPDIRAQIEDIAGGNSFIRYHVTRLCRDAIDHLGIEEQSSAEVRKKVSQSVVDQMREAKDYFTPAEFREYLRRSYIVNIVLYGDEWIVNIG